jgi:hypothetical protein
MTVRKIRVSVEFVEEPGLNIAIDGNGEITIGENGFYQMEKDARRIVVKFGTLALVKLLDQLEQYLDARPVT